MRKKKKSLQRIAKVDEVNREKKVESNRIVVVFFGLLVTETVHFVSHHYGSQNNYVEQFIEFIVCQIFWIYLVWLYCSILSLPANILY